MAFVHCHNCDWEQDDFWSWEYNPLRSLVREILGNFRPRIIDGDPPRYPAHSWWLIVVASRIFFRRIADMQWPTYASWRRVINKGGGRWPDCPKCGEHSLDCD